MNHQTGPLDDRIRRLERSAGRWRAAAFVLTAGLGLAGMAAATGSGASSAPSIVGVLPITEEGATVGMIRVFSDGRFETLGGPNLPAGQSPIFPFDSNHTNLRKSTYSAGTRVIGGQPTLGITRTFVWVFPK